MKAIFLAIIAKIKSIFEGDKEKAIVELHKLEGEFRNKAVSTETTVINDINKI